MTAHSRIQQHKAKLYDLLAASETRLRQRTVARFAQKFGLIYFKSVKAHDYAIPVIRGATAALQQHDAHFCIGSHDGYDMVYVQRTATVTAHNAAATTHYWHIMEFDLHHSHDLPFIFVGTQWQTKSFYNKLFAEHRQIRQIPLSVQVAKEFHGHYTVLGSPADAQLIHSIFNDTITKKISAHKEPFAIEVQGDSLYIMTDSQKTSDQTLVKMLHYGIWLARHIDQLPSHNNQ